MVLAKQKPVSPQLLADLCGEGIHAVMETQNSYARDWTHQVHGANWEREWKARTTA